MKKRLISLVLTALMLLSLLPATAFAAGEDDTPAGNLCRPIDGVTVTATAKSNETDAFPPEKAIDGDTTTKASRWSSANDYNPQWFQIDLGALRSVSVVRLYWERRNVTAYTLQVSADNQTWSTVYTCSSQIAQTTEKITFNPVTVRYIKIDVTSHDDTGAAGYKNIALYEVEVYKDEDSIPVDIQGVPGQVKLKVDGGKVVMDTSGVTVPDNQVEISFAANLEQVVGEDGVIYTPLVDTQVEFDVTVTRFDGVTATTDPAHPITLTIPGEHTTNMGNAKPRVIPELAEWYSSSAQKGEKYTLKSSSKIVAPAELNDVANELQADINDLFGFKPPIVTTGEAAMGDIVLVLADETADADLKAKVVGFDDETYRMDVGEYVTITGTHPTGVYWGTRSVLQALKLSGKQTIPQGTARDYPEFKVRGFVLDVGRKPMSMKKLQEFAKNMAWYKLNDFHVHVSDNLIFMEDYKTNTESWDDDEVYKRADNAYSAFRLESDIEEETGAIPLTAKDYYYTKEEYKGFVEGSAKLGVNIVTEIDVPAHAKPILDAFPSLQLRGYRGNSPTAQNHPYNDHLDLGDVKYDASLAKTKEIFNEYLDAGVFGSAVHFGADEYYASGTPYRRFVKDMINYLKEKKEKTPALADLTIRQWGSLTTMSSSQADLTDAALKPVTTGVQINIWNTSWADPKQMYNLGYDLINTVDGDLYIVPDAGYYFDYLNVSSIYNNWTPNSFGGIWIPASSSQMAGAAYAIWNDQIDTCANGIDEVEVYDRFASALPYISVKMWGEGDKLDRTLSELQADVAITGAAPQTDPYYAKTAGQVSFELDSMTKNNATVADSTLTLKGGESYAETGLDYLGYNSSLSFTITVTKAPAEGGEVVFESDHLAAGSTLAYNEYAIKVLPVEGKADKWKLGFSRELYDYEFATEFDLNRPYSLKLANERSALGAAANAASGTKLYVDGSTTGVSAVGAFVSKGEASNTNFKGKTGISKSYFQIPVARIGSKTNSFTGTISGLTAQSPEIETPEIPEEGKELVNLALRKSVKASGQGIPYENGRTGTGDPAYAVDGEIHEFEDHAWIGADMTTTRVDGQQNPPQWLIVDLGEDISGASLKPEALNVAFGRRSWATKYDIQTSDSENGPWVSLLTKSVEREHEHGYIPSTYPNRWPAASPGDSFTASGSEADIKLKEDATLERYVRLYVTEVNAKAANGSITGYNGQCKSVAVTEFQVLAYAAPSESAENIKAYRIADDQVWLTWDQVGTTYYQVYAKAPDEDWECVSVNDKQEADVVKGNVFVHEGYEEGTVYRVLTPTSDVNSPVNTNTDVVDIRTPADGYVLNTRTDRISYSEGWSTWTEEGYIGPSVTYCNEPTESLTAELVFVGSGIQLIGGMKNDRGRMTVEIDGVAVGEANYRNDSSTPVHQQVVFEQTGLDYGVHTIKLTGVASTGTVEIEAFRVLIPATSLTVTADGLSDGGLNLDAGAAAVTVTANVAPANGFGSLEWTSSDPAVATVRATGVTAAITPVAGGSATITVKDKVDPTITAVISVTVTQRVASVTLPTAQQSVTLYLNPAAGQSGTVTLTPEVLPTTATNKTVTYSSSADGVATVNSSGVVTAVAAGTAAITATADGKSATCSIEVKSNPTGVSVKDGETAVAEGETLVLYANQQADLPAGGRSSATLTAELAPAGVTETGLTWSLTGEQAGSPVSVAQSSTNSAQCVISAADTSGSIVGERTVEVKSTANGTVRATFKVQVRHYLDKDVTITVPENQTNPRPGTILTANTTQLDLNSTDAAKLNYQWKRNGDIIPGATGSTYVLDDADINKTITVTITATPTETYFYEGERTSNTVTVGRKAGPNPPSLTMTPVDESVKGTITIAAPVDGAVYEISSDGATWADATVADGVISGLDAGDYQVRIQATTTQEAGQIATITVTDARKTYFNVSCTVDSAMGAVTLEKTRVEEGLSASATVTPNPGYRIVSVTVGGEALTGTEKDGSTVYTVPNVAADVVFVVTLEKRQFTITHILTNGLQCSRATTGQDSHLVDYGTNEAITLVAETGYERPRVAGITIKRADDTDFRDFTYDRSTGIITITGGVTENLTITAAGVAKTYQVTYADSKVSGPAQAPMGTTVTVTITPDSGYRLSSLTVAKEDGTGEVDVAKEDDTHYTFVMPAYDLTVAAGFEKVYTVTFDSQSGSAVETQTIAEGGKATEPDPAPTRSGYIFGGWYTEADCENAWDFENDTVDEAVTLYAKWTEDTTSSAPTIPEITTKPDGSSTTTTTNPDGSTTTTVTDAATGTVTETTEKPDGTVETKETLKDGTVTETTEKPDGTVETKETLKDGTVTETTEKPDGSSESVKTTPDGTVTETTENPDGSSESVKTEPDGTVTETAIDAEGGKVEKVTTPEEDVTITVTDKDGEELAKVELPAEIPAPETRFVDVPVDHWADEAIHNMAALEVVNGVGGNRYDMDSSMTRGALATVLSRMSNGQKGLKANFADVDDNWYTDGIAWAAKTGVVTGYSATEFGPNDPITREQLAVMLCRYARLLGMDTTADAAALDGFTDGSSTDDWAVDSIAWCVDNGILRGMGDDTLAPTATATRAQVAVMLQRFIDLMK